MAVAYRTSTAGGSSTGTSDRTVTITPAVGDLLVIVAFVAANTNSTPTCSDNNGSGTYDRILAGNVTIATIEYRLSVFIRTALMANTTSTVVTVATGSNTSGAVHAIAVSGMARSGSSAVRSQGQQNNQAAGTPAPVLNQNALTGNLTLVGVGSADTTTTAPTNWTERQDTNFSNDTVALETATRDSGFTSTTITFGAAQSTTFASFAIELDSSPANTDLVVQNASHAHTAGNLALTQVHSLVVANASHAHSAANLALTQVHALTVANASHAHVASPVAIRLDNPSAADIIPIKGDGFAGSERAGQSFTTTSAGSITDLVLWLKKTGSPADNVVCEIRSVSQTGTVLGSATLAASTLTTSRASYRFSFTPFAVTNATTYFIVLSRSGARSETDYAEVFTDQGSYSGGVSSNRSFGVWTDSSFPSTDVSFVAVMSGSLTLTQVHSLAVQAGVHAHAAQNLSLTQVHQLVISNASHAHSAGSPTLVQNSNLVVQDASHAHTATQVALTQTHVLAIQDAAHGHTAENLSLTQQHALSVDSAVHAHSAESVGITAESDLAIDGATHSLTSSQVSLTQTHELAVQNALHGHTASNLSLAGEIELFIQSAIHAHSAQNVVLTQTHQLAIANGLHAHSADGLTLSQVHALIVQSAIHAHSAVQVVLGQVHQLAIGDGLHAHVAGNLVLLLGEMGIPVEGPTSVTVHNRKNGVGVHAAGNKVATRGHNSAKVNNSQNEVEL